MSTTSSKVVQPFNGSKTSKVLCFDLDRRRLQVIKHRIGKENLPDTLSWLCDLAESDLGQKYLGQNLGGASNASKTAGEKND